MSLDDFYKDEAYKTKLLVDRLLSKREKIINKSNLINDLAYERELIIKDIVDSIKRQLSCSTASLFFAMNPTIYYAAWRYFPNGDKIEEEDKERYEQAFVQVTETINKKILLNNKKFKLHNITVYGYDEEAYEFTYKYGKQTFSIKIPIFEHANEQNYLNMLDGCSIYYHESENVHKQILHNIDINQLALDFKEWIKTNNKKEQ